MRRLPDIRAFLTRHSDARVVWQMPTVVGVAMSEPEAEFKRRLLSAGYSGSYFALLGLLATMTYEASESIPSEHASRSDQGERHGYHRGLQTALACLAMHETGGSPRQVALLVVEHTETLIRCRWVHESTAKFSGHGRDQ